MSLRRWLFLAAQAGGRAIVGDRQPVLDLQPDHIHMRTPPDYW